MVKLDLSKKLQLATISPLIIGIIISALSSLSIMFVEYSSWLQTSRSDLRSEEILHLNNVSQSFSNSFSVLTNTVRSNQIAFSLFLILKTYEGVQTGQLSKSQTLKFTSLNFNSASNFSLNQSVWYSNSISSLQELSQVDSSALNITNYFMIQSYNVINSFVSNHSLGDQGIQLGVLLNSGLDFRYPAMNMTPWLSCVNSSKYDPMKLSIYTNSGKDKLNLLNECSYFTISIGFSYGVVVFYMKYSNFYEALLASISVQSIQDLSLFVASADLQDLIFLSTSQSANSESVCQGLFPADVKLEQECTKNYNSTNPQYQNVSFEGYNSVFIGSYSSLVFNVSVSNYSVGQARQFLVGVIENERLVLEGINSIIEEILDVIIFQLAIFASFILFSVLASWKLSAVISNQIFLPITIISRMLLGIASSEETKTLYNKEVNQVIEYLKLLNIFEKFIDPHFLLNPLPHLRIRNLKEAFELFKALKNYRGMAITQNLIGNAYFYMNNYEMAIECYKDALENTEKLFEKVSRLEKDHETLSKNENHLLRKRTGRNKRSWSDQKQYLRENIAERKEQLCMALEAKFIYFTEEDSSARKKLKEINQCQIEILEYYISSRTHFCSMIKVLLNMAKIFECLKYFHSGLELLEIVKDELVKIKTREVVEVDIDITRLKSIGISVKLEDSTSNSKHFILTSITHEKDILMQEMFYRKGRILLKCEKIQEAAHAFTSAIVTHIQEYGNYFDPTLRTLSVTELNHLLDDQNLLQHAKDLQEIQKNLDSIENSLIFVLIYDVESEEETNKALIDFFKSGLSKTQNKTGVILDTRFEGSLELEQRDVPDFDLEDLLANSKKRELFVNLYDPIISSVFKFKEDFTTKVTIALVLDQPDTKGASKLKNFSLFEEKNIILILLYSSTALPNELRSFIQDNQILSICINDYMSFSAALEVLTETLHSLLHSRRKSTLDTIPSLTPPSKH